VSMDYTGGSSLNTSAKLAPSQFTTGPATSDSAAGAAASVTGVAPNSTEQDRSGRDVDTASPQAIEFRVTRSGTSPRRLRLTGHRYTFGHGDGCTIRLNDPTLRPMHAVLIREATRIQVRSLAGPIEINGTSQTEAGLMPGDKFCLGAYEFELLSGNASDRSFTDHRSAARQPQLSIGGGAASSPRTLPPGDEVVWRERLRREVDQWRERQLDCDRRESRIDEREAELRSRESELWSRAENLYRRESRVQSQEAETFQLYDEFAHRQQELMRLREESERHQRALSEQEQEFREQEFEYRRRLAEATTQLEQSKLQAETAAQAVERMRQQFDALNSQIEVLSKDQRQVDSQESQYAEENERLLGELADARRETEQAKEASNQQQADAEARIAEMADRIEQLQRAVDEACDESARLRNDYQQASDKVEELEALVAESRDRGDQDRDDWAQQTEELRAEVERLSSDLETANQQLTELHQANDQLNEKLNEVRCERDEARQQRDERPTVDAFEMLRKDLEAANEQLDEIKLQHQEAIEKLEQAQAAVATDQPYDCELVTDDLETATAESALDLGHEEEPTAPDQAEESACSDEHQAYRAETPEHGELTGVDEDDDVWPTYQSPSAEVATTSAWTDEPTSSQGDVEEQFPADPQDEQPLIHDSASDHAPSAGESIDETAADEGSAVEPTAGYPGYQQTEPMPGGSEESAIDWESAMAEADDTDWSGQAEDVAPETSGNFADVVDQPVESDWESSAAPLVGDESPIVGDDSSSDGDESIAAIEAEPYQSAWSHDDAAEEESAGEESAGEESAGEEVARDQPQAESPWPAVADDQPDQRSDEESNQIAGGSLANELIRDLERESDQHEPVADDNSYAPAEETSVETADQTYEGTFVMSEQPAATWESQAEPAAAESVWTDPQSTSESAVGEDQPADPHTASPWDEVADESVARPDSVLLPDQQADDTVTDEAPIESTAAIDGLTQIGSEEEDEDSIEAYMNRLLRRVQGDGESLEAPMPETISVSTSQSNLLSQTSEPSTESEQDTTAATETHPIDADAPLVPRSQAPERNQNLSAMRDLANSSARSAISRSARVQSRDTQIQAMVSFGCAVGALGCNALAFYFLHGVLLVIAIAMTFIVAFCCSREGLHLLADARRRVQAAEGGKETEDETEK